MYGVQAAQAQDVNQQMQGTLVLLRYREFYDGGMAPAVTLH